MSGRPRHSDHLPDRARCPRGPVTGNGNPARVAVVGTPEEHVRRLMELSETGVDQFNPCLMSWDKDTQVDAYGSKIIPALKAALDDA